MTSLVLIGLNGGESGGVFFFQKMKDETPFNHSITIELLGNLCP